MRIRVTPREVFPGIETSPAGAHEFAIGVIADYLSPGDGVVLKLNAELSALPYRSVATDNEGCFTECEDYSVVRVLCDRFPLEYVLEETAVDDENLNFEIIDEADIEPEADEDDDT